MGFSLAVSGLESLEEKELQSLTYLLWFLSSISLRWRRKSAPRMCPATPG